MFVVIDAKKTVQVLHQGGQLPPPPKHVRAPHSSRTNAVVQGARTNQAYEQVTSEVKPPEEWHFYISYDHPNTCLLKTRIF